MGKDALPASQESSSNSTKRKSSLDEEPTGANKSLKLDIPAHQPEGRLAGFYRLPQEIRDKIYGYYFEDASAGSEIDYRRAINAPQLYAKASANITLASKQMRGETFELFRMASSKFWSDHKFYISIHARWRAQHYRAGDEQLQMLKETCLKTPPLKTILFMISWNDQEPVTVEATACKNSGGVLWKDHANIDDGEEHEDGATTRISESQMNNDDLMYHLKDRVTSWSGPERPLDDADHSVLNVVGCMEIVWAGCKAVVGDNPRQDWRFEA